MRTGTRQHEIIRQLYLAGYVEVKELASMLDVDASTIRRDLDALAAEGRLHRTHGGARPPSGAVDLPYAEKEGESLDAKRVIATAASEWIDDGARILLDAGSTTYQLALRLRERRNLTVVTNDLRIANALTDFDGIRLLVLGGELLSSTYTLAGDRTVSGLADLRVDWTFLGADAIDVEAGITNTNTVEIPLKRMMLSVANQSVVLADSSKFGRRALARVASLSEVGRILTDDGLPVGALGTYEAIVARVPVGERLALSVGAR